MDKKDTNIFNPINYTKSTMKEYFENIIALMPGHVYWKNVEGVILGCNDAQALSAGFNSRKEIIGKTDYDMPWKEQADDIRKTDLEVIRTGIEKNIEEKSTLSDGTNAVFLSKKVPLYLDKKIVGILGISIDITELKNSKNHNAEFVSAAAHEIINPLSNISLMLSEIERIKEIDFTLINDSLSIINNMLISIKYLVKTQNLEKNEIISELKPCYIKNYLNNIVNNLFLKNVKNNLINIYIDKNISDIVNFDHYHTNEILEIIINNSIKYSNNDGLIEINLNKSENNLIFSVKDNGVGIIKKQLNKLFIPFNVKNDVKIDSIYSNPSIKLSYVKKLLGFMNGNIKIESEKNIFTKIDIIVPATFEEIINNTNKKNLKSYKVLLVEDNKITNKFHKKILTDLGCTVSIAENGAEAIKLSSENKYDIIFIDISLPDMNGIQVKKHLDEIKHNKDVLYFAATANVFYTDYEKFHENFISVLEKPVTYDVFESCINTLKNMQDKN